MSTDDGAVNEVQGPVNPPPSIGVGLQAFQDAPPDTGLAPAIEAAGHRTGRAVTLRQVLPGRSGPQDPENAVENAPVVVVRAPGFGFMRRQRRLKALPLLVCQFISSHSRNMGFNLSTRNHFADTP